MRIRTTLLVLVLSLSVLAVSFAARFAGPWQAVGDGIDYQEFHTAEPNDIYVARMDRSNPKAILDSAVALGRISYGVEKVSEMFKRYDDTINYWGGSWGNRSKVVVAINGSYFNWTGVPESGQITSGWYAKRFSDLSSSSGLVYGLNRSVFIGQCVNNDLAKQTLSIFRSGQVVATFRIDGVNIPRGANQLILYTPQYDSYTHTPSDGLEVLVEMTRPTLILPSPANAAGVVQKILDQQGQTLIPFDHVVLSASGSVRDNLVGTLTLNDEIHISQEITSYDKDCASPFNVSWTKAYASVSGDFTILRNGEILHSTQGGAIIKNPRTAMAYNDHYIFFIVVDGRTQRSAGMTFDEVAAFALDTLKATWAIVQDGGGSSVIVVNGQVKNHPVSLCYAIYLPLVINGGPQQQPQSIPTESGLLPTGAAPSAVSSALYSCERSVANSMMMIDVQPGQWSQIYRPNDSITTLSPTKIRLGPGSNYAAITSLPAGAQGVILPLSLTKKLNGIEAKGTFWWKAAFGAFEGWVDENAIRLH